MKSNITKKKVNYITGLKGLTNWVFSKNRKKQELDYLINKFELDNNVIKRMFLYTYGSPHITHYINKYLNHIYHFNKFDTGNLIYSIVYLLDINRLNKKSISEKFLYLKNTDLADKNKQKIKDLLSEYFDKLFDKTYNEYELNFFYDLVNLNAISFENLEKIDKHINSGKSTISLDDSSPMVNVKINNFVLDIYRELSPGIKSFCDQAKEYVFSRPECKGCELYGKPTIILDTNMEDGGEVDLIFFGLNPGIDEVEVGKPFVGKAGKILRERMSLLPTHIKWVITNIILCHTRNENEIKNPEDTKNRCRELVEGIRQTFPAKIIVPLGAKASDWFGLKGGMSNLSGKIFTTNDQTIIPIIHPSAANYNPENLTKFKKDFETILKSLKPQSETAAPVTTIHTPEIKQTTEITIPTGNKFITEVTPDLTFFDVREINNQILMIYIDQSGQKKYQLIDHKLHFYIKNANWRNCDQITEQVDGVVTISGREKGMATKLMRDKLNDLKNNTMGEINKCQ